MRTPEEWLNEVGEAVGQDMFCGDDVRKPRSRTLTIIKAIQDDASPKARVSEWVKLFGISILNPDGWNDIGVEGDFDYKISVKDFIQRCNKSTCQYPKNWQMINDIFNSKH